MEKKTHDFRGGQKNVLRLYGFDRAGLIHALFYRILIFASIIYAILLLLSPFYGLALAIKAFTALMWVLIAPQLFAAMKVLGMTSTRGVVFGKFSKAYSQIASKGYRSYYALYRALPYLALLIWALLFICMLIWWPA